MRTKQEIMEAVRIMQVAEFDCLKDGKLDDAKAANQVVQVLLWCTGLQTTYGMFIEDIRQMARDKAQQN